MPKIDLSDHYTYKKIFRICYSPILMMIFVSLYSVVDGICISNFANLDAFAGANLIFPTTMIIGGIGFMFGTGGSALAGKFLGEKKQKDACNTFTTVVISTFVVGIILSIIGFFVVEPIAKAMGSLSQGSEAMVIEAIKYGKIIMLGQCFFVVQNLFNSFFVLDEKPLLGFIFSLGAGITNIVLDLILIPRIGVEGAAIGTICGYAVGATGPIIYFIVNKKGLIYFTKPKFIFKDLFKCVTNGLSEFVNNVAMSIVGVVYNAQLLRYIGQIGVEAYGIIMYVILLFIAVFIGLCIGICPVISYNYGAKNKEELRSLLIKSLIIISIFSMLMLVLGETLAKPIALIFSNGSENLINLTINAMRIYSVSFLFVGFAMFGSSFFTALNDGITSAIISLVRTLILEVAFLFLLPLIDPKNGLWWSVTFSEGLATLLAITFIFVFRKKYGYGKLNKSEIAKS